MIITVANQATLSAWGRDKSVIGQPFHDALPELHSQPFEGLIKQVLSTGETYYSENDRADLFVDGKLQTYYFKFTYQPLRDDELVLQSVLCFATDVTELERARQEVEKSRETLFNMVRQAPVGICIIKGEDLLVEVVNDAYLELVGRKREEMDGKQIWDAVPEAAETYRPVLKNVIETGIPFHAKEHELILFRNGINERVFIDFVYEPIADIERNITSIMVIAIDVTEKVLALRSIEEAEERARLAIDAAEIGTFDFNILTNDVTGSDRFNQIFGYDSKEIRDNLVSRFHPDDLDGRQIALREAFKTGKLLYEARIILADGSVRWVKVQGSVHYTKSEPVRIVGTVLDITEFKQLQQQKDDFISVASHELKTPMTTVQASMQLLDRLMKGNPDPQRISQFIDRINANLKKMNQLVEGLLNVSKITAGQLHLNCTTFNLADMINDCCEHIRIQDEYELELKGDLDTKVFADRYKIDQVLTNFVNNAVKYAPDSRVIKVKITRVDDFVKVAVQDFGPGIPESKIPHLFERYYRADHNGYQYSGLGLGLFISADIVKRHKGQIGVDSIQGAGSSFWFTLPSNMDV